MKVFEDEILAFLHLVHLYKFLIDCVHNRLCILFLKGSEFSFYLIISILDSSVKSSNFIVHLFLEVSQLLLNLVRDESVLQV